MEWPERQTTRMTWSIQRALADGGEHAEGDADDRGDDEGDGGEFERGGEETGDVGRDAVAGHDGAAEVALGEACGVAEELLRQRAVEAHFVAGAFDDVLRRAVADDGEHRVDGDDAADEEGDQHEAEEGDGDAGGGGGQGAEAGGHALLIWA